MRNSYYIEISLGKINNMQVKKNKNPAVADICYKVLTNAWVKKASRSFYKLMCLEESLTEVCSHKEFTHIIIIIPLFSVPGTAGTRL